MPFPALFFERVGKMGKQHDSGEAPRREADNQYVSDIARLSRLINRHTGIPADRAHLFIKENGASRILDGMNALCRTDCQREKLRTLFEFKNLYETMKNGEGPSEYILDCPQKAGEYFRYIYVDRNDKEYFSIALLDNNYKLIQSLVMFEGTLNEAPIFTREIMRASLIYNNSKIIAVHNHPNGSAKPTNDDKEATNAIWDAMHYINVILVNHIIIVNDAIISLAKLGLIPNYIIQNKYTD